MKTNRLLLGLAVVVALMAAACSNDPNDPPCSTCPEVNPAVEVAEAYIDSRFDSLKLHEGIDRMDTYRVDKDPYGNTHVRMNQYYKRVRVVYGMLIVHVDSALTVNHISGEVSTEIDLDTEYDISEQESLEVAMQDMESRGYTAQAERPEELVLFRDGGVDYLCWRWILDTFTLVRDEYFIDAHTGEIVARYSMIYQ